MPKIDVVTGPYRTGKTVGLLEQIVDYLKVGRPQEAVLVVPSHRYRRLIERRLKDVLVRKRELDDDEKIAGLFGLRIVTFYKLCEEVLRKTHVPFRVIPDKVRSSVVQRILSSMREAGELEALGPISEFVGTTSQALDLIDEFERAALSPADVLVRLRENVTAGSKYMELARIYERYWSTLEELGYIDERMLAFRLREEFARINFRDLRFGFLAVDGFDRFNPLQLQVLDAFSGYCERVSVLFDYVDQAHDRAGDYLWKESSMKEMRSIFGEKFKLVRFGTWASDSATDSQQAGSLFPVPQKTKGKRKSRQDNGQLSLFSLMDSFASHEDARFAGDVLRQGSQASLKKYRALDRFFELQFVARTVKQRAVRDGVSPENALVVVRDLREYRPFAAAIFEDAGVPCFFDEALPLGSLPLTQWLVSALTLARDGFPRRATMRFLRSIYLERKNFRLSQNDIEQIDRKSLSRFVVAGVDQWSEAFGAGWRDAGLGNVFKCLTPPAEGRSLDDWASWVEDLIEQIVALPDRDDERDPYARWEQSACITEMRRALATLVQEAAILGSRVLSYDQFYSRLYMLIEQANFRRPQKMPGAVTICSAELAPNCLFDDVYIVGLVEGEFPRRVSKSGFTSADEIERWAELGVDIHNPRHHPAFESALYNSLLQRARASIVVTCPSSDMNGEELIPSFLLTAGKSEELALIHYKAPFEKSCIEPVSSCDFVAGKLWFGADDVRVKHPSVEDLVDSMAEPLSVIRARDENGSFGIWNGHLSDLVRAGILKVELPDAWSASRLGEYGKCPFRFFVSYDLGITPYEEPETGLTPRDLGKTYHRALEIFYAKLDARNWRLVELSAHDVDAVFKETMAETIDFLEARPELRRDEFWHFTKNEIEFRLRRFIDYERDRALKDKKGFVPKLFETAFGLSDRGTIPPLIIEADGRKIVLRGQIDRIDVTGAGGGATGDGAFSEVRVVDYKSGGTPISEADALAGRDLQLGIYALAVKQSVLPGSRVTCGTFLSVSQGKPTGSLEFAGVSDNGESKDLMEETKKHIVNFVSGIQQGDFSVRPNGPKVCDRCDNRSICRINEMRSALYGEMP